VVELLFCKQWVVGSNPTIGSNLRVGSSMVSEHSLVKRTCVGSNPTLPSNFSLVYSDVSQLAVNRAVNTNYVGSTPTVGAILCLGRSTDRTTAF
jgi:hypothetical protein